VRVLLIAASIITPSKRPRNNRAKSLHPNLPEPLKEVLGNSDRQLGAA
jgi:hypothetical protein